MAGTLKVIVNDGINGAGKTTFARGFLPNQAGSPVFINADLVAAGLPPFALETAAVQAGRVMLQQLARHFDARESFAFETALAGHGDLHHVRTLQTAGYRVKLIFPQLDSAEEAIARVAHRVRQRGHDIPSDTIRRRLSAGRQNFERLLRNAGRRLGAVRQHGRPTTVTVWSERAVWMATRGAVSAVGHEKH